MWEYRLLDLCAIPNKLTAIDLLNEAGSDGWELVMITRNNMAYLKRPVAPAKAARRKET